MSYHTMSTRYIFSVISGLIREYCDGRATFVRPRLADLNHYERWK